MLLIKSYVVINILSGALANVNEAADTEAKDIEMLMMMTLMLMLMQRRMWHWISGT